MLRDGSAEAVPHYRRRSGLAASSGAYQRKPKYEHRRSSNVSRPFLRNGRYGNRRYIPLAIEFSFQPGTSERPVTFDRGRGDIQCVGALLDAQATEIAKLDDL